MLVPFICRFQHLELCRVHKALPNLLGLDLVDAQHMQTGKEDLLLQRLGSLGDMEEWSVGLACPTPIRQNAAMDLHTLRFFNQAAPTTCQAFGTILCVVRV